MRARIASEAGRLAGWSADQVRDLVSRVESSALPAIAALEREGLPRLSIIAAACEVTGLPPAAPVLLAEPHIPAELDAMGIRDAGGTPLGVMGGRLQIAFSNPEAARAAVFSDDVVVCLATDADLVEARARFARRHPPSAAAATVALSAVTSADIAAFARQLAQGPGVAVDTQIVGVPQTASTGDTSTAFDEPTEHLPARAAPATMVAPARRTLSDAPPPEDPQWARLAHVAQLGRLKRFRVERLLGRGGMASVYLATDLEVAGPPLALKVLLPHLQDDPVAVGRFRREVRALMALRHRHIVPLIDGDAEQGGGVLWLSCRFLDGGTLRELLRRSDGQPLAVALPIVKAILEALAHAHASGVIHRDLKPQNILLGTDGSLCVADFGIAAAVGEAPLTVAGSRFGTPAYMAPEQALGGDVDARADLFAAGVIFHELLSGKNPYVRASPTETMRAIARGEVGPPPTDLPPPLRGLLAAMLAVPRDARPPDATAALAVLSPWCDGCLTVDEVVRRLLADPRAFDGAVPGPTSMAHVDVRLVAGATQELEALAAGFDDGSGAAPAPAGAALEAVRSEPHSAFGDTPGIRATMELAAIPANNAAPRPIVDATPAQVMPTAPTPQPAPEAASGRIAAAAVTAAIAFFAVVIGLMLWARS